MKKLPNLDPAEIAKFGAIAEDWWNPEGKMKPLHLLNPLRLEYITKHTDLNNKKILDIGCGGGILSEAMAKKGADVTGIDVSAEVINIAQQHAKQNNLTICYQLISAEALAQQQPEHFDVITCMELLEHVPDPSSIIQACATLIKPNGTLFFSTVNRNLKSYLTAIIGAEYIFHLLPKGTHDYSKLIRPSELSRWASRAGLTLKDMSGIRYKFLDGSFELCQNVQVNYLACFARSCCL